MFKTATWCRNAWHCTESKRWTSRPPINPYNRDESTFPDNKFQFVDSRLNGLVLDPRGLQIEAECTTLQVCHACNGYLPRSVMPRYALANKLYCSRLLNKFQDLTWIEEHICMKYSNTAVVTQIYQSSDPSQPAVFHRDGNTCAHEMNRSSTAAVLPVHILM